MRILFMSAELYPFVKTGGLGDIAATLPPALKALGHDVRLFVPGYRDIKAAAMKTRKIAEVGFSGQSGTLLLAELPGGGTAYILDIPDFYHRDNPYVSAEGRDWPDNDLRFGFFCHVAAQLGALDPAWQPDVIHGNDWHCGLMPLYVREAQAPRPSTVFTIHNIAYQGLFPASRLAALQLPPSSFSVHGLEYHGQIGFMKAGIYYADRVTTVSPTYAQEIQTPEYGLGLDGLLRVVRQKLSGILNGIDPVEWDPRRDPHIAHHYDAMTLDAKKQNKKALLAEFGMTRKLSAPCFGIVSRLTDQKGIDLFLDALPDILPTGATFIILGAGDRQLEARLLRMQKAHPRQIGVRIGYDEALAHRIQAGADAVIVGSRFEPCGLVQIYGLRYGALPVVRRTGGLADSVRDAETGFVFDDISADAMSQALHRAADAYRRRGQWRRMQKQAMAEDFSWKKAAALYAGLYQGIAAQEIAIKAPPARKGRKAS